MNNASKVIVLATLLSSLSCYSMHSAVTAAGEKRHEGKKNEKRKKESGSRQSGHSFVATSGSYVMPVGK